MKITEHNCEEYFLLYFDNELTAAGRKAVEEFLSHHPQYTGLFTALQETKLPMEDVTFSFDKQALYKDEASDIGVNNYEEYFLLYTDNELTDEQKETTERFVLQHPQLQEEFTLLQQTKLIPETIKYKNKADLYKKERRVLPLYITGLSVAAAVFAVMIFAGLFTPGQQQNSTAASTTAQQITKSVVKPTQKNVLPVDEVNQQKENGQQELLVNKTSKEKNKKEDVVTSSEENNRVDEIHKSSLQHQSHEEVAIMAPPEEVQSAHPVTSDNLINRQASVLKPLNDTDSEPADAIDALSLSDNNTAQPAVYKELNTDDDSRTLYVSALRLNKNKVNGILKSASRLLGGHTKQAEEDFSFPKK